MKNSGDGFVTKKKFGQNFLTSPDIPRKIAASCGADKSIGVLEIGPGKGILTVELAKVAGKVCAVEIDTELETHLTENLKNFNNTEVVYGDILDFDLKELIKLKFGDMDVCVCANLPYYITTPILMKLLESGAGFKSITIMVQREVAARLCAKPGSAEYGAITASVNYYSDIKKLFKVPAGCFNPVPKVDSAVIKLTMPPQNPVIPKNEELFLKIIRAAFAQRRKTLVNNLFALFEGKTTKEQIAIELTEAGFEPDIRGEKLGIKEFCIIADSYSEKSF